MAVKVNKGRTVNTIHVVPEFDQLDHDELRGLEQAERERIGRIRNLVDETGNRMRDLHRAVRMRYDREIDHEKVVTAFAQLASIAAEALAVLKPNELPKVKRAS